VHEDASGCRVLDCGVVARGGLEAGCALARVEMAGLGKIALVAGPSELWQAPGVAVQTDHPAVACLASQHAAWRIASEGFLAVASGPIRALARDDPLAARLAPQEDEEIAVGVLESRALPPPTIYAELARQCRVRTSGLILLVVAAGSQAGILRGAARSVEFAVRKLLDLGFEVSRVESGYGVAPLPPVSGDDTKAMERATDAILYGSQVTLWVRGDDDRLATLGPQIPSNASADHGLPFGEIFERYDRDLGSVDPRLFGPSVVTLLNVETGRSFRFGCLMPDVLQRSFT
jgi:methenyltetrahydromethanopterin cyclohydrolase